MSSYERAYLQPYHLHLVRTKLTPVKLEVGQSRQIDLSRHQFERIWSIDLTVEPSDARDYAEFCSKPIGNAVLIVSCWTSDKRPFESVAITCDVWATARSDWKGLITRPFWWYLIQESLFHIDNQDYPVAILLAAMAFEWFLYKFLEEELGRVKNWDSRKIDDYVYGINILDSIIYKVELLVKEFLEINYSK